MAQGRLGAGPLKPAVRLGILIAAAAAVWTPRLADRFVYPHDANAALYSLAARNHLRLGLAETKGANCLSVEGEPCDGAFYLNHPGTLSLVVAASFAVLGESEAAARLVPVAFSLAALALLHAAVRRRWDDRTADLAGAFFIAAPFTAFYAKMLNFEPLVLPLGLVAADRYARAVDCGDRRGTPAAAAALAAAQVIDHQAVAVLVGLAAGWGLRRDLVLAAAAVAAAEAWNWAHVVIAGGPAAPAAVLAAAAGRASYEGFTPAAFAHRQVLYLAQGVTIVGLAAAAWGLWTERAAGPRRRFIAALAAWPAAHALPLPHGAWVHDYWLYHAVPVAAILAARAALTLPRPVAVLVVIAFLVRASWTVGRYHADDGWYDREFAAADFARAHAPLGTVVLTREPMRTAHAAYYADRRFVHEPDLAEPFAIR